MLLLVIFYCPDLYLSWRNIHIRADLTNLMVRIHTKSLISVQSIIWPGLAWDWVEMEWCEEGEHAQESDRPPQLSTIPPMHP